MRTTSPCTSRPAHSPTDGLAAHRLPDVLRKPTVTSSPAARRRNCRASTLRRQPATAWLLAIAHALSNSEAHLAWARSVQAPDDDDGLDTSEQRRGPTTSASTTCACLPRRRRSEPGIRLPRSTHMTRRCKIRGGDARAQPRSASDRLRRSDGSRAPRACPPPPACDDPSWDYLVGPARRTVPFCSTHWRVSVR